METSKPMEDIPEKKEEAKKVEEKKKEKNVYSGIL
jgi:hypothetical protein